MMVTLITNKQKDPDGIYTKKIIDIFKKLEIDYYLTETIKGNSKYKYTNPKSIPKETDVVLTLGGDGTILQAVRDLRGYDFLVAGINLGTLGYLAETEMNQVEDMLIKVKNKKYIIETRMMLDCHLCENRNDDKTLMTQCLNDLVIRNTDVGKTIGINLYVNDKFVTKYYADGIIVSTPTGSTAYNLTAGGPIIEPTTSMMIVTPLCSFALGLGSIVFGGNDKIVLELDKGRKGESLKYIAIFDGVIKVPLKTGDKIELKKSIYSASFMKFTETSFLEILREKMKNENNN